MGKFRRFFGGCRIRAQTMRGTICWRCCSSRWRQCCAERNRARIWRTLGSRRKGCCGSSFAWSMASRATIRSAGCSVCSSRRLSNPHIPPLHGRLCQGQWSQPHRRGGNRRQGLARRLPTRRGRHAAADGQCLCGGCPHGLGSAESAWSQRDGWCLGSAGPSVPRRLHCHRRRAALPPRVCGRGAPARRRLCSGDQGEPRRLFTAVVQQFARSGKRSLAKHVDPSSHDRHETRRATVMRNTSLATRYGFPGVVAVGRVTLRRRLRGRRADAPVVRHYLLSKYISPKRLLHITRSHWGIENRLHWVKWTLDFGPAA